MLKLIRGILDFRRNRRAEWKEIFKELALGQRPDSLFIACSDSRVVPNLFASSDPGDLFVIRNIGNLIAPHKKGEATAEAAAIEFSLANLPIRDVIVCGHSHCGAMCAVEAAGAGPVAPGAPGLEGWLAHVQPSLQRLKVEGPLDPDFPRHDQLSQLNVLQQIEHLKSYPVVRDRLAAGTLALHAWWFDIGEAEVRAYDPKAKRFRLIDSAYAEKLIRAFGSDLTRVQPPPSGRASEIQVESNR